MENNQLKGIEYLIRIVIAEREIEKLQQRLAIISWICIPACLITAFVSVVNLFRG